MIFGAGMSEARTAASAAREATIAALAPFGDVSPKVAIVFASVGYDDVERAAPAVRDIVGDAPIVGGTAAGGVFESTRLSRRGVSVVLLGGADLEVASHDARTDGAPSVDLVEPGRRVASAADEATMRGFVHYACLVFAPGVVVDGEPLVAAVRKGAGARAQLAGALTGDDFTMSCARTLVNDELRADRITITGLFTKRPIGIASRHGQHAVGPERVVTKVDDVFLCELDGRPALDVWIEDTKSAGGRPPTNPRDLPLYLLANYAVGIALAPTSRPPTENLRELVARAPFTVRGDGAIQLAASVGEGMHLRLLHATHADLMRTAKDVATAAVAGVGHPPAGALVLACSQRLYAIGDGFTEELAEIRASVGAPIAGTAVLGEIARNWRDADAFFNLTATIIAFPS